MPGPRSDSSPSEPPDPPDGPPAARRPHAESSPAEEPGAIDRHADQHGAGDDRPGDDRGGDRPADDRPGGPATGGIPRRRRISAAGAVIGLLLGLLGFALVVQLRSNSAEDQLSSERPEDLVRLLSDLDSQKDRLGQEISQQQTLKQQLTAGTQSRQAALDQASQRADALGILAGTLPAEGPGLRVQFRAASKAIRASDVLDTVEELRGAGAEAMQISGKAGAVVRIVASTSFVDGANGTLVVDDETLNGPYTITVIGDPSTMQIALNIPSGVVDTVHSNGGTVSVIAPGTVQVTALHQNTPLRYAKPVS
ncbi:DUF881 domain-containing protein [Rugosimonospora acidiphila]|uniref:DUF881 domain-containing protein n=1 Tax=Rugosimonospora acidiphila TaxID=556531 RepID=UPI003CD08518